MHCSNALWLQLDQCNCIIDNTRDYIRFCGGDYVMGNPSWLVVKTQSSNSCLHYCVHTQRVHLLQPGNHRQRAHHVLWDGKLATNTPTCPLPSNIQARCNSHNAIVAQRGTTVFALEHFGQPSVLHQRHHHRSLPGCDWLLCISCISNFFCTAAPSLSRQWLLRRHVKSNHCLHVQLPHTLHLQCQRAGASIFSCSTPQPGSLVLHTPHDADSVAPHKVLVPLHDELWGVGRLQGLEYLGIGSVPCSKCPGIDRVVCNMLL